MLRTLRGFPLFVLAAPLAACSLINAPEEIKTSTGGSGGSGGTGGTTSSSSGGTGGAPCIVDGDCPDPGACMVVACKEGQCKVDQAPNNTPCDDGRFCTDGDLCANGQCTPGPDKACTASDACHVSACDEATMACVESPTPDGALCDDGDACTATSTCIGGLCTPGPGCQSDECNTSTCDPNVGCITAPNPQGTSCGNTFCSTGQCDGAGKCVTMALNVGLPCDDGLFCTANETCTQFGLCQGSESPCSNPAPCVLATCNEDQDICDFNAILAGESCEDGDACTGGETCDAAAKCSGAQAAAVLFQETFVGGNSQGWDLGPEWQIGQATASMGGTVCCDPAVDFDGDGQVAGVVIGGNQAVTDPMMPQHPFYYLTSPPVDTQFIPGPLYLTYYRWLNSDYPPFMHNSVEVSMDDGLSWFVVWNNDGLGVIQDGAWTFQWHDVSPYKSPAMRVRFGYDIGSSGVYIVGSWNLDHIRIQNAKCPQ